LNFKSPSTLSHPLSDSTTGTGVAEGIAAGVAEAEAVALAVALTLATGDGTSGAFATVLRDGFTAGFIAATGDATFAFTAA
jgi:hypothetical protein